MSEPLPVQGPASSYRFAWLPALGQRFSAWGWVVLFPLALVFHLTNWKGVFTPAGVLPLATDSYLHLNRVERTLEHFPLVPNTDFFINFPVGGYVYWPVGFDFLYAALVKILTLGNPTPAKTAAICAVLTPVFSAMTPCFLYWIGRSLGKMGAGWWAGMLLAVLPQGYLVNVGYIDHHLFESFWLALYLLALVKALHLADRLQPQTSRWLVLAGLCVTAGLLFTTIFPVVLGLHGLVVAGLLLRAGKDLRAWGRILHGAFLFYLTLVFSLSLFVATHLVEPGKVNPALTLAWLGAAVACVGLVLALELVCRLKGLAQPRPWKLYLPGAVTGALVMMRIDWPGVFELGRFSFGFLTSKSYAFVTQIEESQPLTFFPVDAVFWNYTGLLLFWFPAAVWLLWKGWRGSNALWAIALLNLPLAVMAFRQLRFMGFFIVPFCLTLGWFGQAVWEGQFPWPARLWPQPLNAWKGSVRKVVWIVVWSLCVWVPTLSKVSFSNPIYVNPDGKFGSLYRMLAWMQDHTPPVSHEATAASDYAVIGEWGIGHWVRYFAGRPVVASPLLFPEHLKGVAEAAQVLMLPPPEATALAQRRRARYLLITPFEPVEMLQNALGDQFPSDKREQVRTLNHSLYAALLRDAVPGKSTSPEFLRKIRLVHEVEIPRPPHETGKPTYMQLFEFVPGVSLSGTTAPQAVVSITATIQSPLGRLIRYTDSVQADANGVFSVTLPYAGETQRMASVGLGNGYTIKANGKTATVTVTEAEVVAGAKRVLLWPET
ncbi:MAG: hypothetical protein K1Y36_22650 [Blastocatellia bacterium]|nr:hypothetical protein [Blastocatellia bacterium]